MATPNLDDWTDTLDERCRDYLAETIQYAADGDTDNYADLKAHVDYRDMVKPLEVGQVLEQDIMVSVLKSDVPVKPGQGVRLTLPKLAGKTFRPVNPRSDESGTGWEFEVQRVS